MTVDGPLPLAAEGYAVDTASGVVHRRYAGHAIGLLRGTYRSLRSG